MAALDTLIPLEASISGAIALGKGKPIDPKYESIRTRYQASMDFLKSGDDAKPGRSKLTTYVEKQESWNKTIERYANSQQQQQQILKDQGLPVSEQREKFLEWIQANARDYKASIQARYMDWVVHGYKFEVEFNFGVVDISSGMKRIESSKEAFRNLTLIASDGASEYSGVVLTPSSWASKAKSKFDSWGAKNNGPSALELRGELKRLQKLLLSHQAMIYAMDGKPLTDTVTARYVPPAVDDTSAPTTSLVKAYAAVYTAIDKDNEAKEDLANKGMPSKTKPDIPENKTVAPPGETEKDKATREQQNDKNDKQRKMYEEIPANKPVPDTAETEDQKLIREQENKDFEKQRKDFDKAVDEDVAEWKMEKALIKSDTKEKEKKVQTEEEIAVKDAFTKLRAAQAAWEAGSLESNKKANRENGEKLQNGTKNTLELRMKTIEKEIVEIQGRLKAVVGKSPSTGDPGVIDAEGKTLDLPQLAASSVVAPRATDNDEASVWTRISVKVSRSSSSKTQVTQESASSFAAKVNTGLWSASGGAAHTSAATKAMSSMSSLDVEISLDCMLVEIERPWLHGELFNDHELDAAEGFPLSPGPESLHKTVANNEAVHASYAQFCSYPTAFVLASNVELEFTGDTSNLESALESSSTDANLSVGYGPFSVSGSHSQSKSKGSSKAETTATGMRISLQAPQIIAWVQELLPELPKPKGAPNSMFGLALQR